MKSGKGRILLRWALAVLCAAAGYLGGGLLYARYVRSTGDDGVLALYLFNALQQGMIFALPALLILSARPERWQAFRGDLRPVGFPTASLSLLLAVSGTVVASAIAALWSQLIGYAGESPALPDPRGAVEWPLSLAAVAAVPALCEELLFRGLIQSALCRRWPRAGVWIAAAVFAALHLEIGALPALLLIGLVLGKVYRRYGYWGSALVHALYNGVVLVLSAREVRIDLLVLALCTVGCIFSLRGLLKEEETSEADGPGV